MKKILFFLLPICFIACQKKTVSTSQVNPLIPQAQAFFNKVLSQKLPSNSANYRADQVRNPDWNEAVVKNLSVGPVVEVPVHFKNPLYISTDLAGSYVLDLSGITKLVLFPDSSGKFHYQVLTFISDSNAIAHPATFTGIVLSEDWSGNSLAAPASVNQKMAVSSTSSRPVTADILEYTVCTEIDGYNYSADDPDDGVAWSETTCSTYGVDDESGGSGGYSGSDFSALAGSGGTGAVSVQIPPPTNPIGNMANYLQCFTNVGGSDHSYTISVCVSQPDPGTRVPWVFYGNTSVSSDAGNLVNVGHTFLILTESSGGTSITRNIGFDPSTIVAPPSPSSPGVFNDDENHSYNISGSFTLTNSQFFTVLNYINGLSGAVDTYNLNTNNCTTFAINSLYQAGVDLPRTTGSWLGGSGYDPGDLGQDMVAGGIPGMTVSTVGNYHPNVGQCN